MERPRPSTIAWAALVGGVIAYDLIAPQGETLSEGMDGYLEHPLGKYATYSVVGVTALHLLNILPPKADPIHQVVRHLRNVV